MTAPPTEHVVVDPGPPTPSGGRRAWRRLIPRTRRGRLLYGAVLLLVVLGLAAWLLFFRGSAESATTFRTVTVARETLTETVSASGTINPARQADLSFTSAGEVTSVRVEVGDTVKAGDTLATIDDSALEIAHTAARADLTAAKETLADLVDSDASDTAIAAAEATVEVKRNALAAAKRDLKDATLTAPFSGIVAEVAIAKGDTVGTGSVAGQSASDTTTTSAITLISKGTFTVSTSVSNADVAAITKGLQATITATGAGEPVFGTVTSVGVMATSSTSGGSATFPVEITVTGKHDDLLVGSSATVAITTAKLTDVISVPTQAITTVDGQPVVTRLVDGREVETPVAIGEVVGSSTVITDGLVEGDQVVVGSFRVAESSTAAGSEQQQAPGGMAGGMPPEGMPSGAPGGTR